MQFKDLKTGYPVYLFDRDAVSVTPAKVVEVTPPHFDNHYGNPTEMVVDLKIEVDGKIRTYTFKDGTEVGYLNNLVIATSCEGFLREVGALKMQSEQFLAKKETYEDNIKKCNEIYAKYSPEFKQKQENEERFNSLESSVKSIQDMVQNLIKELKG